MLYWCEAFRRNGECNKCGCNIDKHKHIAWEYVATKRIAIDPKVEAEIRNTKDGIKKIQAAIKGAEQLILEYQEEARIIQDINAKFAYVMGKESCLVSLPCLCHYVRGHSQVT